MADDRARTPKILKGIPAAPGFVHGSAVILHEEELSVPRYPISDAESEQKRLSEARDRARQELAELRQKVAQTASEKEAEVFTAHQMFLDDKALLKKTQRSLESGLNVEACWMDAIEFFATQLEAIPDPTLSARAVDIRDVGKRVLKHLLGRDADGLRLDRPAVIIARDLAPSQTVSLNLENVLAFCTAEGGPTSHTAILAKSMGLPAIVALGPEILSVAPSSTLLVDGMKGEVVIDPDEESLSSFLVLSERNQARQELAFEQAGLPAVTRDGKTVEVVANIGGLEDARSAILNGAEGVGLFRTEFLYLDRDQMPAETEQIEACRPVFEVMQGKPVVVRTLDIGGDKAVSYIGFPEEANPFLGWRAIRMNSGRPDVFQNQVRALLQVGAGSDLRIMIPMVSNLDEILTARQIITEAQAALKAEGLPYAREIQFGVMVEIPSAALMSDLYAPAVDFFSIGTNDLTQYTLAVDRTNARVAHLASPFHPAVLRLIHTTIQSAHKHAKWVGVCGEMAGDPAAVPLLLGLGLDEFSMAPSLIPVIKQVLRRCSFEECRTMAAHALNLPTTAEVIEYVNRQAEGWGLY